MFRWTGIVAAVIVVGFSAPPAARADPCGAGECGKPQCSPEPIKVRPTRTRTRTFSIYCHRMVRAQLLEAPPHTAITEVSAQNSELRFVATTEQDAPREEQARFEIRGTDKINELTLDVLATPLAENTPPNCFDDTAVQHSLGLAPVELYVFPGCRDAEGDEFTITGTGPGVHPDAPAKVTGGFMYFGWRYRTATRAGTETTTLAATDEFGARSRDASITVTVGPDVNRPPTCRAFPSIWTGDQTASVLTRAGAIRRFGVQCYDPDEDPVLPVVTSPPARGLLAPLVPGPDPGAAYEATYAPASADLQPDSFTLLPTGVRGNGPEHTVSIVPTPEDENGFGGCSWGGIWTQPGVPATMTVNCVDYEGDPLTATIAGEPAHGIAARPISAPGHYGSTDMTIAYAPAPGFEGLDCIKVVVTDGRGSEQTLLIDVTVQELPVFVPEAPPVWQPYGPPPFSPPYPVPPSFPTMNAAAIAWQVRQYVSGVLGTTSVRRTQVLPDVEVWSPRRLSRRRLVREGRAPAMVVLCSAGCSLRSGPLRRRAQATRTAMSVAPAQPQLLWATATRRQLRRAARVRMRVGIRRPGAARTVRRAFRVR